ncbi:MAG TPA: hypothetical protein VFY99_11495 [Solirubrobacterales bacterium]
MEAAAPPPAAQPPAPGPRPLDLGAVFSETFSTYTRHAGPLLGVAIALYLVIAIIAGLGFAANGFVGLILFTILAVLGLTLYSGFVVRLVEDVRDGRRDSTVGELLESAMPAIGPLIGNGILKALAVAVGFILLIVPGLILLTIWAVTAPAIVVERAGVIDAFSRSWELVRGQAWMVFAIILLTFLLTQAVTYLLGAIGDGIGDFVGYLIFQAIAGAITAPIGGLVAAIIFFDLGGGQAVTAAPAAPAAAPPPPAAPAA